MAFSVYIYENTQKIERYFSTMGNRFYQSSHLNIERMIQDVERSFLGQGYQAQHFSHGGQVIVQVREGSDFEAVLGMQAALTVILQPERNGVVATIGEQKWIDKAAVGLLGAIVLWPLLVTSGVGVIRQANLEHQLLSALDSAALKQGANIQVTNDSPFFSQTPPNQGYQAPYTAPSQAEPMPGYGQKQCARCQALNDADDAFCSQCGATLTRPKTLCANCKAELKADAAFCTKCGTAR